MTITLTDSQRVVPKHPARVKERSPKASFPPPIHIATDLPCPADKDLEEIPHPAYTPDDISRVQGMLLRFVPAELADAILDMAEYWPWTAVSRNSFTSAYSALEAPDHNAQWCYLVTPKIPSVERDGVRLPTTVKMVKFFIKTYESSFGKSAGSSDTTQGFTTWFESAILKNGEPSMASYDTDSRPNDWYANLAAPHPKYLNDFRETGYPGSPVENPFDNKKRWHVATNPQANTDKAWHQVTWKHDDIPALEVDPQTGTGTGLGFVDSLSVDDQVVLLARAKISQGHHRVAHRIAAEQIFNHHNHKLGELGHHSAAPTIRPRAANDLHASQIFVNIPRSCQALTVHWYTPLAHPSQQLQQSFHVGCLPDWITSSSSSTSPSVTEALPRDQSIGNPYFDNIGPMILKISKFMACHR
ncbi:hypothetical protein GALMADRAFT_208809 [Galerina marginata CBS 339.88]|uniref:Uncharacterized protein n=1 Tax=Galerina marginata (strain CBS 339.88) TaxID=685588 RepID=A0A067T8F8_GALM3|nr:hypothetical protein GALMADRAFT_208809 [Galerina marginata CBS 339.88]